MLFFAFRRPPFRAGTTGRVQGRLEGCVDITQKVEATVKSFEVNLVELQFLPWKNATPGASSDKQSNVMFGAFDYG